MQTILKGHAIYVAGTHKHADHTYVTSSDGHSWACWGRETGGSIICLGEGDSDIADCISQSSSHAGIIYGVTGVCHQTANRILRPARKTVSSANGYSLSWALYGVYGGTNRGWMDRQIRCHFDPESTPQYISEEIDTYFESINSAHLNFAKEIDANKASLEEVEKELAEIELKALIDKKIKEGLVDNKTKTKLTDKKIKSLINSRSDMLKELEKEKDLIVSKDSFAGFGDKANLMLNDFLKSSAVILGKHDYKNIFDVEPGDEVIVVEQMYTI